MTLTDHLVFDNDTVGITCLSYPESQARICYSTSRNQVLQTDTAPSRLTVPTKLTKDE